MLPAAATNLPPTRSQFAATVAANHPLCRDHYRLVLRLPNFPTTHPGQFIQVACRDLHPDTVAETEFDWHPGRPIDLPSSDLTGPTALLRRPFSLAGRRDLPNHVELDLIHRVVGVGTDWLSRLRPGDHVHILGPLGNVFTPPPAGSTALLIGGGVGIPPMLYLADHLAAIAPAGKPNAVAFAGALTRDLLPLTISPAAPVPSPDSADPQPAIAEFSRHGIPSIISTDDGSYAFRGFITQALERYLDRLLLTPGPCPPAPPTLYTCGPEPMMKRVADIAAARGLPCQVAVERAMACGMGTCQSCCIRVRKPDPSQPPLAGKDWCYRLACTDGPVFSAADLLW